MPLTPVDDDPFAAVGAPSKLTPVDHDPFATAPSGGSTIANVLNYSPLGSAAPEPQGLGATAIWNKPADVGWGDYMLAHLAKPGQQLDDLVRGATNTFGLGDRFAAGMNWLTGVGGGDLAQQRATSAVRAKADPLYGVGQIAGYGPLAETGIAARLGGGVMGTAGELATGGALAGAGNSNAKTWTGMGEDALAGGVAGGLGGAALGAAGKYVVNPIVNAVANKFGRVTGALSTPADITASTKQAKEDAYDALKDVPVDMTDAAAAARDAVEAHDPGNSLRPVAGRTMAVLNRIDKSVQSSADQELTGQDAMDYLVGQRASMSPDDYRAAMLDLTKTGKITTPGESPPISAYDVRTWLDQLRDIQGPNAGAENELAPIVEQHLNDVIDNAGARGMFDSAAAANKTFKNAQFLQQGRENLKYLGQSPAGEAARIAQTYYGKGAADLEAGHPTPDAAAYKALSNITLAGGGIPSAYSLMHSLYPATEAAGAGLGAMVGGPGGALAGEMAGGLAGGAAKTAMSSGLSKMQSAATRGAMDRAYPALTGGQSVRFPPIDLTSPAVRALLFGQAARYF